MVCLVETGELCPVPGGQVQGRPTRSRGGRCAGSDAVPAVWPEAGRRRDGQTRHCRGRSPVGESSSEGRAAWGVLPFWVAGITFAVLLCARLDFLSGPARVCTQVFSQERSRSLNVIGPSGRFDGRSSHISHHSKVITANWVRLQSPQLGAGGQGAWALWALEATSGGSGTGFLRAPLSEIPARQLSTGRGSFPRNFKDAGKLLLGKIWRKVENGYDQSLKTSFIKPKSARFARGPEHMCSV